MKSKPRSPSEGSLTQEGSIVECKSAGTGIMTMPETGIMTQMTRNGGGAGLGVSESGHDVGIRESRVHIPVFEEALEEIDAALGDGSGKIKVKADAECTASIQAANRIDGALNLIEVEILEENLE
nr:hypothetical protein CFP56_42928 [Quercus suber]